MNETELVVSLAEDDDARVAALLEVYQGIPNSVVLLCERERVGIARDTLDHLRSVRDALAPYGRFKAWCQAAGYNYSSVYSRLDYHDNDRGKVAIADSAIARSLLPPEQANSGLAAIERRERVVHLLASAESDPEAARVLDVALNSTGAIVGVMSKVDAKQRARMADRAEQGMQETATTTVHMRSTEMKPDTGDSEAAVVHHEVRIDCDGFSDAEIKEAYDYAYAKYPGRIFTKTH